MELNRKILRELTEPQHESDVEFKRFAGEMFVLKRDSAIPEIQQNGAFGACEGCEFIKDDFACHHMKSIGIKIGCGPFNGIWKKAGKFKRRKLSI